MDGHQHAKFLSALAPLLLLAAGCATGPEDFDPARWDKDLAQFAAADRESPPAQGGILFLGSSSIRRWDSLTNDFAGLPVLNRGFGGSHMSDAAALADRLVFPYAPRQILLYEGDNDLNKGKSPRRVLADFRTFATRVHERLPNCRISIIAIKPCPKRWHLEKEVRRANELLRQAAADSRVDFIDVFTPMLDAAGQPSPELFVEDGVHMTPEGYAIWTRVIRPYLIQQPRTRQRQSAHSSRFIRG